MSVEEAVDFVRKCENLAESIKFPKDYLVKDRLDGVISTKSKDVENAKSKLEKALKERTVLLKQVQSEISAFNEIAGTYKSLVEQNNYLKKTEHAIQSQMGPHPDDRKTIEEIKWKIKIYKQLTALRFDFNAPEDVVSGFIQIKADTPRGCFPVTFILDKNEAHITDKLWDKIGQASHQGDKEILDFVNDFHTALKIKN